VLRGIRLKLGGSHVPADLRKRLRESITQDLYCGYGTTETGAIAFTDPNDSDAAESVGQALPGIEIRVTDADRKPVAPGERGEIAIRCAGMFQAYWNQPAATRARLVDDWFQTGDTGFLDDQHRLHLSGRTDDMFVFNSINIHPQDIEAQICQYPSVVDAAVLPKHSPVHGDVPVALVVFKDGASPDLRGLKKFVRDSAGLRTPRQFTIVDRIPRNATGKILRAEAQLLLGTGRDD
jgi:acyl-coenzyme A synthetase/AMP-(fatty) acid ligase